MIDQPAQAFEAQAAPAAQPPDVLQLIMQGQVGLGDLFALCGKLQVDGHIQAASNIYLLWLQHTHSEFRHVVLYNYGSLLQQSGKADEAIVAYSQALAIDPLFPEAVTNLGLCFESKGDTPQALAVWLGCVNHPQFTVRAQAEQQTLILNHIGRVQEDLKRYAEAESTLVRSLAVNPKQVNVLHHWVHIRQKACAWPAFGDLPNVTKNEMMMATSPLAMLALTDDPVQQLLTAHAYVGRTWGFDMEHLCAGRKYAHSRIRIGFVSGDLCTHAVGVLLPEFLEAIDKNQFELYAYDFSVEDGTALRARLKAVFDHFVSVKGLSDRAVAEKVLSDEIDVLFDMHGLSAGARPGIFKLRAAPIQMQWLGYIGTTAMPWIDYVVTDPVAMPQTLQTYFTEKPFYLEGSFLPLAIEAAPITCSFTRADCGLPEDAFVMASWGNVYKLNPGLFKLWMSLLKAIDRAVLWVVDDNPTTTGNLLRWAQSQGVDASRIVFHKRSVFSEYQQKLSLADVFLDTFPYNCGSTARDVIKAGVPLLTHPGRSMISRMGASVNHALGLSHLVAADRDRLRQLVIDIAKEPERVASEKRKVRQAINELGWSARKSAESLQRTMKSLVGSL
jgi:predicted O-linked N-acetylglucosamine transferase (SPINDLY family)